MSRAHRFAALAMLAPLALSLTTSCSRNNKRAEPRPTSAATSAPASVATTGGAASDSSSPASSSSTVATATPTSSVVATPSASPSATSPTAPSATPSSESASTPTPAESPTVDGTSPPPDPAKSARALLVDAAAIGRGWMAETPEDDHERGDICGNVTGADKNRVAAQAIQLTNDSVEGSAVHEVALFRPGTAAAYRQRVDALLGACTKVQREFDGSLGSVTAARTGPGNATYTVTFDGGVQTFGAIAISVGGDYVSTTTAYAENTATAAQIVAQIDALARRTLASRPS